MGRRPMAPLALVRGPSLGRCDGQATARRLSAAQCRKGAAPAGWPDAVGVGTQRGRNASPEDAYVNGDERSFGG